MTFQKKLSVCISRVFNSKKLVFRFNSIFLNKKRRCKVLIAKDVSFISLFIFRAKNLPSIYFFMFKFFRSYFKYKFSVTKPILIMKRSSLILPSFVGFRFIISNGKYSRLLLVNREMVGFCFGEFFFTRKFGSGDQLHLRNKKKQE